MGSTRGTAVPCAHPGEGCRTDPQHGAGWLQTEAELFPFPGTPPGTAEPSGTSSSPGEAGTDPAVRDGVSTAAQPSPSAGATDAAAGREGTSPTPPGESPARVFTAVTMELSTAPAISTAPKTEPIGNEKAESSPTPQRTLSHSSSHMMVPSSSRGQWGTPSTVRTALTQSWEGSLNPSHPALEPEGRGATIPPSDIRAGTPQGHTADSPVPGTSGTLSFVGGLQSLQSPPGELGRIHQVLAGTGPVGESHSLQGTTMAWLGPHATSRPPLLFSGVAGHGGRMWHPKGPGASTTLLPMESRLPPDPSTTAAVLGVTFPGPEGAPDLTTEVLGLLNIQSPPGPNHVPMNQTWHISALPGEAPPSLGPQPSLGLIPTADTHPAASPGHEHAERPQVPGGTPVWAGDAGPWAVTAPPSTALPAAPSSPLQPALTKPTSSPPLLTFSTSITSTATSTPTATSTATATSPALLRGERTAPLDPISAACRGGCGGADAGAQCGARVPPSAHRPPPGAQSRLLHRAALRSGHTLTPHA
ncbi:mucin-5AC-like [Centrocercus urophasianus]|uniref:mucin-5AC-like n=1 Tax=Centrocercus urophasianus TaxID=9002 RepID=UPI001C64BEDE|nr:mucin-5AC-like [Centrocercus urophasianus]